jgi:hypothetical protein
VRLCDESDEVLRIDLVDFRVQCWAAREAAGQTGRSAIERAWGDERRRLRELFSSLAEELKAYA